MAQQFDQAKQQAEDFIAKNPDNFRGQDSKTILQRLYAQNPDLFNQLNGAFHSEIEKNQELLDWAQGNPAFGVELQKNVAPTPAPAVPVPDTAALEKDANQRALEYRQNMDNMYGNLSKSLTERLTRSFAPGRSKLISEEASLGRLSSPVSAETLGNYDRGVNDSIGTAQAGLAGQQASGSTDMAKTIESLLAGERGAKQQAEQFNADLGLRRYGLDESIKQGILDRQAALDAGRARADASKPSNIDRGFQAAGTAATIGALLAKFAGPAAVAA